MKRTVLSFFLLLSLLSGAQNALRSYQWRDHLSYNKAFSVTTQGNKIFAVGNSCAFSYNKNDNSYERLNKVYGFSDIEPSLVRNNPYNNALVIIYKNSNIDILKDGVITNVGDLFRKQNIGDKTINSVTFNGDLAYLACGFGIVVLDTRTYEFKDTYIIGPNGINLFVYQVALSNTDIFAATKSGLYKASLSSPNLSSYTNWSKVTSGLPTGIYNGVVYFGGNIITSYSRFLTTNQTIDMQDTLFQFNGTVWSKYLPNGPSDGIRKISVSQDKRIFIILDSYGFVAYDTLGSTAIRYWGDFFFTGSWHGTRDVVPDVTEAGTFWLADQRGLYKVKGTPLVDPIFNYKINGPEPGFASTASSNMAILENKLIMAPAFLDLGMFNSYNQDNVFTFDDNSWATTTKTSSTANFDINCVAFDINDKNHYYAGTWWNGIIEYVNDVEVNRYDYANTASGLHETDYPGSTVTRIGALAADKKNNLWAGMGETQSLLSVKPAGSNSFTSLDFTNINMVGSVSGPLPRVSKVMIDSTKQVWALAYGVGIFIYRFNGNFDQPNSSNAKKITNVVGKGGLSSNEVISIAEDKNGDIWVGTDKGISVFYNPESIFEQTNGWDAQPIYIEQDGKTQLLLQTEEVSSIAVDGANNKWCGTRSGGVYCFSEDGQKELYHFTTENSPLFSNTITDIKVNPKTGEVFIGTDKGVISFQNIITEGYETFTDVYAYPNPVKPTYDGPILIHGMVSGAVVKIVDVTGNFVYETIAKGGQAVWDGKDFKGKRAATGVYIVLCAISDGSDKVMTKILLLN